MTQVLELLERVLMEPLLWIGVISGGIGMVGMSIVIRTLGAQPRGVNSDPPRNGVRTRGYVVLGVVMVAFGCMGSLVQRVRAIDAILAAAERGDVAAVKQCLRWGADPNIRRTDEQGWSRRPLHAAARHGHVEVLRILLDHGADANAKDSLGSTPLHQAATHWTAQMAELLLAHGADANARDQSGMTPLGVALQRVSSPTAEFLRKHGGVE